MEGDSERQPTTGQEHEYGANLGRALDRRDEFQSSDDEWFEGAQLPESTREAVLGRLRQRDAWWIATFQEWSAAGPIGIGAITYPSESQQSEPDVSPSPGQLPPSPPPEARGERLGLVKLGPLPSYAGDPSDLRHRANRDPSRPRRQLERPDLTRTPPRNAGEFGRALLGLSKRTQQQDPTDPTDAETPTAPDHASEPDEPSQ